MTGKISADLLRGHTDTIILNMLQKRDCYGYDVYKRIKEVSGGRFELKEPTLYAALRRLEQEGKILSYWGSETQGGRRKYLKITAAGTELLHTNLENYRFASKILAELLG